MNIGESGAVRKFRCCDAAKRSLHGTGNGRLTRKHVRPKRRRNRGMLLKMPVNSRINLSPAGSIQKSNRLLSGRRKVINSSYTQVSHARIACSVKYKSELEFISTACADTFPLWPAIHPTPADQRDERRPGRDEFIPLGQPNRRPGAVHTPNVCHWLQTCNETQKFCMWLCVARNITQFSRGIHCVKLPRAEEGDVADSGNVAGSGPRTREGR